MKMNDHFTAMNKPLSRLSLVCSFFILVLAAACNSSEEKKEVQNEQDITAQSHTKATIPIEGMTCNACVASVKKKLGSLDGIEQVKVSLVNRNAIVFFEEATVTEEQIKDAINELGYKAGTPVTENNE